MKRFRKSLLVILLELLLLAFAAAAFADDTGELVVTSFPDGAHVYIDGADTGKVTPMEVEHVTAGQHVITVSMPGWTTDTRSFTKLGKDTVGNNRDTHLSFSLLPVLTTGPQGPAGAPGPQGPQGLPGPGGVGLPGSQGLIGPAGPTGPVGPKGNDGAVGPAGPAGPMGPAGATGAPGIQGSNG